MKTWLPIARMSPLLVLLFIAAQTRHVDSTRVSPWTGRALMGAFSSLYGNCPQGPSQENSIETMLNNHDWWEQHWGRSGASWPRRGFQECWENRGDVCPLPDQDHVVCLPGSRRGSTVSRGWALDPKSQACKPGVHCLYACEPGYYWTAFNQGETSNFDFANGPKRGHCDGTWDYGTSTHGVYCREDGTLQMPSEPLCKLGETFVYAENRLDQHVFLCQTVFPGHEIFLIPTLVKPGETVMITTQPKEGWHGPTYPKTPHGDIYVSFAGADIMEACTWDGFSPSGAALLPYEIGSGIEDNGQLYSTHYFYQQPNSEVPANSVGYVMDLECESSVSGVCGQRVAHNNVITMVTQRKPPPGTTKVKFIFKKPESKNGQDYLYRDPNKPNMPNPAMITGLKDNGGGGQSYQHYRRALEKDVKITTYVENTLSEHTVMICNGDEGQSASPISVTPGERIQLDPSRTIGIGIKHGKIRQFCAGRRNLLWVLGVDPEEREYRYEPVPEASADALLYRIEIMCASQVVGQCVTKSKRRVRVEPKDDAFPSDTNIVFRIGAIPILTAQEGEESYDWGQQVKELIDSPIF